MLPDSSLGLQQKNPLPMKGQWGLGLGANDIRGQQRHYYPCAFYTTGKPIPVNPKNHHFRVMREAEPLLTLPIMNWVTA
jgi:hypothetical protein